MMNIMTRAGFMWRYCMINTLCSWLHGDERGFRSREPEIRSSGDYKNPPPPEEYRKSVPNPYSFYGDIDGELEGKIPQKPGTVAP